MPGRTASVSSGKLLIGSTGKLRIRGADHPFKGVVGSVQTLCPCPECVGLTPRSVTTCKTSAQIVTEYSLPAPTWTAPEPSNMCVRLLMWTGFYYHHPSASIKRRSDDVAISNGNYTYCWRMASWCGSPSPNNFGREVYHRPEYPPAERPWSCLCWDYSTPVGEGEDFPLLPISEDSFEYTDTIWEETSCGIPSGSNPLFDPIWADIVAGLGADYDGYSLVIHIVVSTTKWASSRTDMRHWEYPEIHGYQAAPKCLVFPPNSLEACEWEGISSTYDTECP